MLAYTYVEPGKFELQEKPKPELKDSRDAIVRVTLGSICTSDLHIKHGSVPRAVPGVTVGHEMVGVVEDVGEDVIGIKPGDRVTVNVETFCGECFFCRRGYVNKVQMPVGPAPIIRIVSSDVISEIRTDQKPVAKISPTNKACSSLTVSGIRFKP